LLDGRTMLRDEYAMLSNQQRKPSFKLRTSDEFGSGGTASVNSARRLFPYRRCSTPLKVLT
jgi:hypothetical protein